jgi:2'-5' RNA ligase
MAEEPLIPGTDVPVATLAELQATITEIRNLEGNVTLARTTWARQHGLSHAGARDTYSVFGYDDVISTYQYRAAYERGGIAGSIVDVMPEATWRGETPFELIEDEDPENDTEFELAWKALEKKHQIFAKFLRVDKLSRLSTYAVLLIGAEGDWNTELPRASKRGLLYLMPFLGGGGPGGNNAQTVAAGADATVYEYVTNSKDPRFGLPLNYTIKRTDVASSDWGRPVHWTRIIHIAENLLDNEVFGQPALERVWNLLMDLNKVTGGGAEAFYLRANQGLHLDIDKDMTLESTKATVEALKEQADAYKHQLTRWLRTRGVKVETLGSDVANFAPPAEAIITQIAGAKRIPKRILTGSEMGELASSQDRENFRDQIIGRQTQHAAPYIIKPLVDRLIQYGYLPTPKKETGYTIKWPHIQVMTEQEKVTGAQGWATVNSKNGETVYTDAEIRGHWSDLPPLTDEQRQEIADRKMEKAKQDQKIMEMTAPPESEFKAAESRKFSSTQIQLPPVLAQELLDLGKSIPAFDLCVEEGGLEEDAHITVKYGLHTNDAADVRKVLATYVGPIRITLGKTNVFAGPEYDVLYVEVFSQDLKDLNQRLEGSLENTTTHPVYTPHATVAYLKTGLGVKYVGLTKLEGMSATIGSVRFSSSLGEIVDLRVTGRNEKGTFAVAEAAEDVELVGLLSAAIEAGDEEMVGRIVGLKK